MKAREIRQKYLEFFKERGHAVIPSASLLPENDSTLLFVNSGMSPLVPYLSGEKHPLGSRLADSQKSFRSEDIEEVGDNRHDTFFEMLGNWSLGDYYKEEQLNWWYEFLVEELKLDPNKLYQTVYFGDDSIGMPKDNESIEILKRIFSKYTIAAEEGPETAGEGALGPGKEIDFSRQRIFAYRDKNWWQRGDAVGELGGPDSETFYDTGKPHDKKFGEHCHLNCDCGRFIEIGNSVFMQYQRTAEGWKELANKNVDFGGGLERIAMAEQGLDNIFKTDLFSLLIDKIEQMSGKRYEDNMKAFEIIADHIKAAVFIIGDEKGIGPSNIGQGYIVRRLIRRAIRFGRELDIKNASWTKEVARIVVHDYNGAYPELTKNYERIISELEKEESKFAKTIENGLKQFEKIESRSISGKDAFELYQSYGFPIELFFEELDKRNVEYTRSQIEKSFEEEMLNHQELSRTASAGMFKGGLADASEQTTKLHTAAHLMLSALRKVLGDHVIQRGSNITAERLRFDFSHNEKMTPEQIVQVEKIVNDAIEKKLPVICKEMSLDEAKSINAMGVFENKYGEKVKVFIIGENNDNISKEICGGPHVENVGQLGKFKIAKEESSSAGVRRIKAILE